MQLQNTEVGIGFLLKVKEMKIKENGILYYFEPLEKTVVVASLSDVSTKDLIFSVARIKAYQDSILVPTNMTIPKIFENLLKKEEKRLEQIYNPGDYFAEVIQILK